MVQLTVTTGSQGTARYPELVSALAMPSHVPLGLGSSQGMSLFVLGVIRSSLQLAIELVELKFHE